MLKKALVILMFAASVATGYGQEFICQVQINSRKVQGIDPATFSTMKTAVFEFINNRKWTNYNFKFEERIKWTILITINQAVSSDEFQGQFNVVLQRPVYNTDYNSPILNIIDKDISFIYRPNQPLNFVENTYTDNLTSLLAFYSYFVLGQYFDTFSQDGGTDFYQKAMSVVQSAQNSNRKGWQSFESQKNRYHLVDEYLNAAYEPLRQFLYDYHRQGLDVMYDKTEMGRSEILKSLSYLKKVNDKRPGMYSMQVLLDAKRTEIINIFKKGTPIEKTSMINIMKEIDPGNSSRYQEVLQ
jgi:hypothetical protein